MSHFSNSLIAWYEIHKRDLPWRHTENPYYIWVSEIMLQQTQAQTVIPYYHRFIETLPTLKDLAFAEEDLILKLWEGLGYYSRVRNMKKTAQYILENYNGIFPNRYEDLIKLTGIGEYTAGAILSIAYHQKWSAIDGNVSRVLARYFGFKKDITLNTSKKMLTDLNHTLLEDERPHLYTQAMIELGATLCTKHNPKCDLCPVSAMCVAKKENLQSVLPVKAKAKAKTEKHFITFILQDENNQYLVQKVEDNLLKGLYLLPQVESDGLSYAIESLMDQGIEIYYTEPLKSYKHVFTHLVWSMDVYFGKCKNSDSLTKIDHFNHIPMATAHKQIIHKEKHYGND